MSDISSLTKELQIVAETELNEKPDQIRDKLNQLNEWLNDKPQLKSRLDDRHLLIFLRRSKHNLQTTKVKIEKCFEGKMKVPEICANQYVTPDILKYIKIGAFLPLEKPNGAAGPAVILIRSGLYDPQEINLNQMLKGYFMMLESFAYKNDNAAVSGLLFVVDFKHASFQEISQFTPKMLYKLLIIEHSVNPMRLKGVYCINTPAFAHGTMNLLKKLLSVKLQERVKMFGSDFDSFAKLVPKEILPEEYGGEAGKIEEITDYWVDVLQREKENFKKRSLHIDDEALFGREKSENIFGTQGSFKQLNID